MTASPEAASALAALQTLLGEKGFSNDPDVLAPWLNDWRGLYQGNAIAMLSPASVAEVQDVVRIAAQARLPLVPQGGNTSMVGGATPDASGACAILSLRRLNQIRMSSRDDRTVIAEAGVILSTLHEAAEAEGLRFPLTLAAKGSATIGGLVSTNAGGTQVLRFGTMRKLVHGLEAVLPDGQLFSSLNGLKKDNRGYDLTQLLIGAEGTLGIVTATRLQLVPGIHDRTVAWVGVASPHAALALLRRLEDATGAGVEGFEVVSGHAIRLVCQHIPGTRAPLSTEHPWNVLIEFIHLRAENLSAEVHLAQLLGSALEDGSINDAAIATSEAQAEAFWRIRETVSEAERASGPAIQHDISVPVTAMPDFMIDAAAAVETRFPGITAGSFGHLGDGNVHFHVRAPAGVDAAQWRKSDGKAASDFVYDLVVAAGGSISAEHGIGQMKRDVFMRTTDTARLSAMLAIKQALDPLGIMNPDKLLPLASTRHAP